MLGGLLLKLTVLGSSCFQKLFNRVYAVFKVKENHTKINKYQEGQGIGKNVVFGQGKSGKSFGQIFDLEAKDYCHLETTLFNDSISFFTFRMYSQVS